MSAEGVLNLLCSGFAAILKFELPGWQDRHCNSLPRQMGAQARSLGPVLYIANLGHYPGDQTSYRVTNVPRDLLVVKYKVV